MERDAEARLLFALHAIKCGDVVETSRARDYQQQVRFMTFLDDTFCSDNSTGIIVRDSNTLIASFSFEISLRERGKNVELQRS